MVQTIKRYIITGAPGTGKTSVLDALRPKGYTCFNEVSRELIIEQQKSGGQLLPWANLKSFAAESNKRMELQNKNAQPGINLFDRGIPDIIAYLQSMDCAVNSYYYFQIRQYERDVFYFPVWPEIFVNDPQRPETLERALELDYYIRSTYMQLGFNLIKIEFASVQQRVSEIENVLNRK